MEKLYFLQDLLEPRDLPSFNGQDLPTKQAQIKREKTKEDLTPFLTILGTSQRAAEHDSFFGRFTPICARVFFSTRITEISLVFWLNLYVTRARSRLNNVVEAFVVSFEIMKMWILWKSLQSRFNQFEFAKKLKVGISL